MSFNGEKKFVMKHTFTDVKNSENETDLDGEEENHFNIPWNIFIHSADYSAYATMFLNCLKEQEWDEWSIDVTIKIKVFTMNGEQVFEKKRMFTHTDANSKCLGALEPLDDYLVDGNLTVECHVTIHKVTGFKVPFVNNFNNDLAKELSDVVLKVKENKFHVCKLYLSYHSTYFKTLFLGNFNESKQSEVELKDIEPEDFQNFLKVIYATPDINDDTVEGILKLADMYDSKVAVQQCEKFLVDNSKLGLKEKFLLAIQYKLENLKKKCMPEFKTANDIASVIPEDPSQLENSVWKELLNIALTFSNR